MQARPTRRVTGLELVALAVAVIVGLWANRYSNWDLPLLAVLLTSSVVGDLTALDAPTRSGTISSSFLAIFVAAVLLGPAPAALIGVVTILVGWLRFRYSRSALLINVVAYAWYPLLWGSPSRPPCGRLAPPTTTGASTCSCSRSSRWRW